MAETQAVDYERIVRDALIEVTGFNDDEIALDSKFYGDLGAESIDDLDLAFRLEKALDIRIPYMELIAPNYVLNDEYINRANDPEFHKQRQSVTVQDFITYIARRHKELPPITPLFTGLGSPTH